VVVAVAVHRVTVVVGVVEETALKVTRPVGAVAPAGPPRVAL